MARGYVDLVGMVLLLGVPLFLPSKGIKALCSCQAEFVTKDDLKEFISVVLLHAWVIFIFVAALNTFESLVEFTIDLKFISWLSNMGVPLPLLGIQVLLTWLGVFVLLATLPCFLWVRSKLRSSSDEHGANTRNNSKAAFQRRGASKGMNA